MIPQYILLSLALLSQEENPEWVNWIATSSFDGNQTQEIRARLQGSSLIIETIITDKERPKETLQERRVFTCDQIDEVSSLRLEDEQGFSHYLKMVWHEDGNEPDHYQDRQGRRVPRAMLLGPYSPDRCRSLKEAFFRWRCL